MRSRVAMDPRCLQADSEDSDQTGRMSRLIVVYAGRTLILLVLSCRGSNDHDCKISFIMIVCKTWAVLTGLGLILG